MILVNLQTLINFHRYQDRLARLGGELEVASGEMKRHLAEYKRLMSVKLSLEKEIHTYRRLLEGEEGGHVFHNFKLIHSDYKQLT